jgi:hypothetical protein
MALWWCSTPISDRTGSPGQAFDFAEDQGRGHHLGASAPAQAAQHDLKVGQVTAREPDFVVHIADDVHRGPHGGNGPQVRLEHLARQPGRQPDPGEGLHRAARWLCLRRDRPDGAAPGYPAPSGPRRNTGFSMIILDHGTESSRAPSTTKVC